MPIVEITLLAGCDAPAKRRLIAKVTDAVVEALATPADQVRIVLREVAPLHFGVGGATCERATRAVAKPEAAAAKPAAATPRQRVARAVPKAKAALTKANGRVRRYGLRTAAPPPAAERPGRRQRPPGQ